MCLNIRIHNWLIYKVWAFLISIYSRSTTSLCLNDIKYCKILHISHKYVTDWRLSACERQRINIELHCLWIIKPYRESRNSDEKVGYLVSLLLIHMTTIQILIQMSLHWRRCTYHFASHVQQAGFVFFWALMRFP